MPRPEYSAGSPNLDVFGFTDSRGELCLGAAVESFPDVNRRLCYLNRRQASAPETGPLEARQPGVVPLQLLSFNNSMRLVIAPSVGGILDIYCC
jgi:hypothetical protein